MANLFCVRAFYSGFTAHFLKGGYTAIGWLPSDNLGDIWDKSKIYELYREEYPEEKNKRVGQNVGQIARFLFDIRGGDYVIVPGYDNMIYIGEVDAEGQYYYDSGEDGCPFRHRRAVKWDKEPYNKRELADKIQSSLKSSLTVFRINDPYFSLAFARNVKNQWKPEKSSKIGLELNPIGYIEKRVAPTIKSETISFSKNDFPNGEVTLFYGTTRNKIGGSDFNNFYGGEFDANEEIELRQGLCIVNIPSNHNVGVIERPKKILLWKRKENTEKDVVISCITELINSDFNNWLVDRISTSGNKSALIFIHGYNNTFAEAARRTAQLTYDIPFNNNISGFFSWSAKGGVVDYERDTARVESSITAFTVFIENLVQVCGIKELHFIAHSMGNQLLTKGLLKLTSKPSFQNCLTSISQIVLAAPDIDQTTFKAEILPYFKYLGANRTLYASKFDKALIASEKIRMGLLRLGEGGDNIFVADGLDTIDASNVESDFMAHSYVFEGKETLTDLFYLINNGLKAEERPLQKLEKNEKPYYIFRA